MNYIQPPEHFRYPRPYRPGPIPHTKKEWRICAVCTTLYLSRIGALNPRKTCGNSACIDKYAACYLHRKQNMKAYWRKRRSNPSERKNINAMARKARLKLIEKRKATHPNYTTRCLTAKHKTCSNQIHISGNNNKINMHTKPHQIIPCECPCHTGGELPKFERNSRDCSNVQHWIPSVLEGVYP